MAAAIDAATSSGVDLADAVQDAAAAAGREAGDAPATAERALADAGYEPRAEDGALVLLNCPFHRLAQAHTDLVCGLNLAFVRGLLDATDAADRFEPQLDPCPGRCCVVLARREADETPATGAG
jgi:predicted ArsR family transcriptional regulator